MKSFVEIRHWDRTIDLLHESEGELTDEIAELIAINQNELYEAVEEQLTVIAKLQADNENLQIHKQRLESVQTKNQRAIDVIKDNLRIATIKYGGNEKKIKSEIKGISLWIQKTKTLNILDEDVIQSQYTSFSIKGKLSPQLKNEVARILSTKPEIKFERVIDKAAIKKAVESGTYTGRGVQLEENEHLRIS